MPNPPIVVSKSEYESKKIPPIPALTILTVVSAAEFSIIFPVYEACENRGGLSFLSSTVTNTVANA